MARTATALLTRGLSALSAYLSPGSRPGLGCSGRQPPGYGPRERHLSVARTPSRHGRVLHRLVIVIRVVGGGGCVVMVVIVIL